MVRDSFRCVRSDVRVGVNLNLGVWNLVAGCDWLGERRASVNHANAFGARTAIHDAPGTSDVDYWRGNWNLWTRGTATKSENKESGKCEYGFHSHSIEEPPYFAPL